MKILGITGPSGSGKGRLSEALAARGFVHADADAIYHELLASDANLRAELVRAFGADVERDGVIDRKTLGKKVFGAKNRRKLERLNKIAHKYVCRDYIQSIRKCKEDGVKGFVIDAPLLFEARLHTVCDAVVTVLADEEVRISRIMARDGIDREAALLRIRSQKPIAFYVKHCDYLFLNNDGADADAAAEEIETLLTKEARP